MKFEFDPAKDEANRTKHGVPLAFGALIFGDVDAAIVPTVRLGDEKSGSRSLDR